MRNTFINPWTMVIKFHNARTTRHTMMSTIWFDQTTQVTVPAR